MTRPPLTAVLPVKELVRAKSRLALPAPDRRLLALAFARDTMAAVLSAGREDTAVVVTSDEEVAEDLRAAAPDRVRVVPDGGTGLDGAVRRGVLAAHADRPGTAVCVVPADLPCLRPGDVDRVLASAGAHRGVFVPDLSRTGTTVLVLPPEHAVTVRYGPGSADRHAAAGLVPLPDVPRRVRQDVDTLADLLLAIRLGTGPATSTACEELGLDRYGRREAG